MTDHIPIEDIPKQELLEDLAAFKMDLRVCALALIHGHEFYGNGQSISHRAERDRKIIKAINAELKRRYLLEH